MVTRVAEEGDSVAWGGASGGDQHLYSVIGATQEAGLGDHAPQFGSFNVAQNHHQGALKKFRVFNFSDFNSNKKRQQM